MKKFLFLVITISGLMMGCSEKNTPSTIPILKGYGTIQCVNNNSDPYLVSVKGNTPLSFTLEGKTYTTKTVEEGYYNVHVTQKSGYIFYATEKDFSFYVEKDENTLVSF